MKEELKKLVKEKGAYRLDTNVKNFSEDAYNFILTQTGDTFSEKLYRYLNDINNPINPITNKPCVYVNFTRGFRGYDIPITEISSEDWVYLEDNITTTIAVKKLRPYLYLFVVNNTPTIKGSFTEKLYCLKHNITNTDGQDFINYYKGYKDSWIDYQAIYKKYTKLVGSDDLKVGENIHRFLLRNARKTYEGVEGVDYVVCPVLNVRMQIIRSTYVENILCWTMDEYLEKFPDVKLICDARLENIKTALYEIEENGKTVHQNAIEKATITKNTIGEDGLTINDKIGLKTKATHMNNIDENGLNGYDRIAKYRNETILDNGLSVQANGLIKNNNTRVKNGTKQYKGGASNISKIAFAPILDYLNKNSLKYYFDENEYCLNAGTQFYFYDLTIPELKLCIEFQGKNFHPDINLTDTEYPMWRQVFTGKNAIEIDQYDRKKAIDIFNIKGFLMWYVYEKSYFSDVNYLLDCIKVLNNDQ